MKELDYFRYLRVDLRSDEGLEAEWRYRIGEGRKVAEALKNA